MTRKEWKHRIVIFSYWLFFFQCQILPQLALHSFVIIIVKYKCHNIDAWPRATIVVLSRFHGELHFDLWAIFFKKNCLFCIHCTLYFDSWSLPYHVAWKLLFSEMKIWFLWKERMSKTKLVWDASIIKNTIN